MDAPQKSKQYVFISYSSKDKDVVWQINTFLGKKGISTWMAPKSVPLLTNHREVTPEAILDCDVFILCLSRNAQKSEWVDSELEIAYQAEKPILPIRIDDCEISDSFAERLTGAQRLEAFHRYLAAGEELARTLCNRWQIPYVEDPPGGEDDRDTFDMPFLSSLVCQRLSSDPDNQALISEFSCTRNPGLEAYLQLNAWSEDSRGDSSVYLIKNRKREILMFFSLQCGTLVEPLHMDELYDEKRRLQNISDIILQGAQTDEEKALLKQAEKDYDMDGTRLGIHLQSEMAAIMQEWSLYYHELVEESNPNIHRVATSYPAVELAQFSVNDRAKEFWNGFKKQHNFERPMGELLFWLFIVPEIRKVQRSVGCSYVYTYSADATKEKSLTRYLQERLNFRKPDNIGVSKSFYNFTCEFLCQTIDELKQGRRVYFEALQRDVTRGQETAV